MKGKLREQILKKKKKSKKNVPQENGTIKYIA